MTPETTVLVIGGPADRPLPVSAFEYWYVAESPYRDGDYARAIELASEGFAEWPDHPVIHFQLACYHAMAAEREAALDHLERASTAREDAPNAPGCIAAERSSSCETAVATDGERPAPRDNRFGSTAQAGRETARAEQRAKFTRARGARLRPERS